LQSTAELAFRSWGRITCTSPGRRSSALAADERGDGALQRLQALGDGRIVVLADDGAADVVHREPRVGQLAGRGDHAQVRLVGAAADGAEVLQG
jgi:hypothetical protein